MTEQIGTLYYVCGDKETAEALFEMFGVVPSDLNSGLDSMHPLATIAEALKRCEEGDAIMLGDSKHS